MAGFHDALACREEHEHVPLEKINLSAVHSINSGTFKASFPCLLQQNQMIYILSEVDPST